MESSQGVIERVGRCPLVSVDLVLVRGSTEVLLGLRTNRPAQGSWFVPGGRIPKDERRADALTRVARRELGIDDQHAALRWWPIAEATASADVHRYTRDYLPLLG